MKRYPSVCPQSNLIKSSDKFLEEGNNIHNTIDISKLKAINYKEYNMEHVHDGQYYRDNFLGLGNENNATYMGLTDSDRQFIISLRSDYTSEQCYRVVVRLQGVSNSNLGKRKA
jgi:hypothetical protein